MSVFGIISGMTAEELCWYGTFALGVIWFILGICYVIKKRINNKRVEQEHFVKAAFFEFIACWILYIPEELFNDIPNSVPALKAVESLLTALLRTFNIYNGNGYIRVAYDEHAVFSSVYAILMTLANIVLLLFIFGFIIKFFVGPLQRIRLSLLKHRRNYIFSVCNDKTFAIASSIKEKEKGNLVFVCSSKDLDPKKKEKLDEIRAIYIDGSLSEIFNKVAAVSEKTEIFLFGNDEDSNLDDLEQVIGIAEKTAEELRIFVELTETPWSLYDGYRKKQISSNKNLIVNFVCTEENFAYNNLLKNSIFENSISMSYGDSIVEEIRFLLVGMNERNLEMFKAVLHLSQKPGYRLTLMVIDPKATRNELKQSFPEIQDEYDKPGDAIYRIMYRENISLESDQFERIISEEFSDFTFAFINAGNDVTNIDLAMRLNTLCFRNDKVNKYVIQVNIRNGNKCRKWNEDLLDNISFVGDFQSTYDYKFITMSDIEEVSSAIHQVRRPEKPWSEYCNDEYNRHSVYARTLSAVYGVQLRKRDDKGNFCEEDNTLWAEYEHMRWDVYTRTLGYVVPADNLTEDKKNDKIFRKKAKIHPDLKEYQNLPDKEKGKDEYLSNDNIVKIVEKKINKLNLKKRNAETEKQGNRR